MTVSEARKILGKDARDISDAEVQCDIEAAELLKDLFLHQQFKKTKPAIQEPPKMP